MNRGPFPLITLLAFIASSVWQALCNIHLSGCIFFGALLVASAFFNSLLKKSGRAPDLTAPAKLDR